ncbi:hypothetical protein VTK26DRAFT_223 [Humicola hyalothermophila]
MLSKFLSVALAASLVSAQTFTDCDPTKRDDCPNPKAVGSKIVEVDFRKGKHDFFEELPGTKLTYDDNLGAVFSIKQESNAPTISSGNKYIFFGQVDVTVRTAPGNGIVTSFVLQSDDLDEIDWEWLGGDNAQVQSNYFSKGCTEVYDRGAFHAVNDPIGTFHTYTIKWTPEQLDWIIDGAVVRTLVNTGVPGCSGYPQSPMQIKLGTWVAGRADAPQGTIDWAGGLPDWNQAPFNAYYQSLRIQDYMGAQGATEATEYRYTDRSGTWQSIEVVNNGEKVEGKPSTTTSTTAKPTTSKSSTSAPTTLSTVSSSIPSNTTTTSISRPATTATPTETEDSNPDPTSPPQEVPTGAAGKLVGNLAAAGAAALVAFFAL